MKQWRYILNDEGQAVPEPDLLKWAQWFETADNQIAHDQVGDVHISTIFIGLDHGFGLGDGEPVLWETMLFGGKLNRECRRYTSRRDALKGHAEFLALILALREP